MSDEEKDNPGLVGRVGDLEVGMGEVKTDIKWIKVMVLPTFLISFVSLLILVASYISG